MKEALTFTPLSEPAFLRTQDSGWGYLEQYFRSACWESDARQEDFHACISSIAVQLLIHLTRACTHSRPTEPLTEKRELMDEVISYIEDHLAEKITLQSRPPIFL